MGLLARVKGKTFGLSPKKTSAGIIPEVDDAVPHAVVAPVEEEMGREEYPPLAAPRAEETQGVRLEREARDLAAAWQSSPQLGQPLCEGGLASGSNVDDMPS